MEEAIAQQVIGRHRCHWANWKFSIGDSVQLDGDRAIIMDRHCTIMGKQVFKVRLLGEVGERANRYVLGRALS